MLGSSIIGKHPESKAASPDVSDRFKALTVKTKVWKLLPVEQSAALMDDGKIVNQCHPENVGLNRKGNMGSETWQLGVAASASDRDTAGSQIHVTNSYSRDLRDAD